MNRRPNPAPPSMLLRCSARCLRPPLHCTPRVPTRLNRMAYRALSVRSDAQTARIVGMGVRLAIRGCKWVFAEWQGGRLKTRDACLILAVPVGGVCVVICQYGLDNTMAWTLDIPSSVETDVEGLSEERKTAELQHYEAAQEDLRRVGPVTVLAGTEVPATWTSEQRNADPSAEFVCVPLLEGDRMRAALKSCLQGNDIGKGGRDALTSQPYDSLELVAAWRVENRTLWGKFAAERQQVQATMRQVEKTSKAVRQRVLTPHLRRGLAEASAPLRAAGGCDSAVNEVYLFHGLGDPCKALNIIGSGLNEHFSGVNAGTMFGDGLYFAEDMGKSDQYCAPLGRGFFASLSRQQRTLDKCLWGRGQTRPKDGVADLRFVFVCRTVLGVYAQVGVDRTKQLHSSEALFAAGTRELALIPGIDTPTHFHSEIAEVAPGYGGAADTWQVPGGNHLRFREFVIFRPTLLYPEYLVAYRRTNSSAQ